MSKTNSYREWGGDELEYLQENYDSQTAETIAKALERTPDSVYERAGRMGLRKHAKRHARTAEGPWHCPDCNQNKPKEEFGKHKGNRGSAYCKACTNLRNSDYKKKRKK